MCVHTPQYDSDQRLIQDYLTWSDRLMKNNTALQEMYARDLAKTVEEAKRRGLKLPEVV